MSTLTSRVPSIMFDCFSLRELVLKEWSSGSRGPSSGGKSRTSSILSSKMNFFLTASEASVSLTFRAAVQEGMGIGTRVVVEFDPSTTSKKPAEPGLAIHRPSLEHRDRVDNVGSADGLPNKGGTCSPLRSSESMRTRISVQSPDRTQQDLAPKAIPGGPRASESVYRGGESNRTTTPWTENRPGVRE